MGRKEGMKEWIKKGEWWTKGWIILYEGDWVPYLGT